MPNSSTNYGWWDHTGVSGHEPQMGIVPTPVPKLKPQATRAKLNICGGTGHDAYTIPISYGMAQCLACNLAKRVGAEYTPRFTEKRSLGLLEPPPIEESILDDPPDDGDFESDEEDHEEPYEEDQP